MSWPTAGPTIVTPRARSVATLATVAGFCHISVCMAGATTDGRPAGQDRVAEQVRGEAARELREKVRRGGGDHDQVGRLADRDVPHLGDALVEVVCTPGCG